MHALRRPGAPGCAGAADACEGDRSGGREGGAGAGGGRGKKRRQVDSQAVQENLRKTLSQLNETKVRRRYDRTRRDEEGGETEETKVITVSEFITVGELAEQVGARTAEVIATCLGLGTVVTINQRLDMDTITMVADDLSGYAEYGRQGGHCIAPTRYQYKHR